MLSYAIANFIQLDGRPKRFSRDHPCTLVLSYSPLTNTQFIGCFVSQAYAARWCGVCSASSRSYLSLNGCILQSLFKMVSRPSKLE